MYVGSGLREDMTGYYHRYAPGVSTVVMAAKEIAYRILGICDELDAVSPEEFGELTKELRVEAERVLEEIDDRSR